MARVASVIWITACAWHLVRATDAVLTRRNRRRHFPLAYEDRHGAIDVLVGCDGGTAYRLRGRGLSRIEVPM